VRRGRQAFLIASAAALLSAPVAGAYDRSPVPLAGLQPDGWSQTTTNAQINLRNRYPGIVVAYCVGVIMLGYEAQSSTVHGLSRYWDKLFCVAFTTRQKLPMSMVYDQKSASGWVIYRLRGGSVGDLY
jgi:hypothetical protein